MWNANPLGSGLVISILLEVPSNLNYNNCMLDREEQIAEAREEHIKWVDGEISKFYWEFADDLSEHGSERMDKFLNGELKEKMLEILMDDYKAWF